MPSVGGVVEEDEEFQFLDLGVDNTLQVQKVEEVHGAAGGGVESEMPKLMRRRW